MSWILRPSTRIEPLPNSGSSVGISFILAMTAVGILAARRLHRLQVVQHAGIDAGLHHGRHVAVVLFGEPLRPLARLVVEIPVEAFGQHQALRGLETQRMHVGEEHQKPGQRLAALGDAEFGGLLDRVDGVAAGIGEADHLGARRLRLQQEGREVGAREGMADRADDFAAGRLDDRCRVALQRVAEGVVGGQEEPLLAAGLQPSRCRCRWRAPRCHRSSERCWASTWSRSDRTRRLPN